MGILPAVLHCLATSPVDPSTATFWVLVPATLFLHVKHQCLIGMRMKCSQAVRHKRFNWSRIRIFMDGERPKWLERITWPSLNWWEHLRWNISLRRSTGQVAKQFLAYIDWTYYSVFIDSRKAWRSSREGWNCISYIFFVKSSLSLIIFSLNGF